MVPAPAAAPAATDLTGLEQLRHRAANADPGALKEAAAQFDALFIGMMLKSARAASLGKGIFDSEASSQYLELMDDQVALELARKGGLGFGKLLLEQVSPRGAEQAHSSDASPYTSSSQTVASFAARLPAMLRALSSGDAVDPLGADGDPAATGATEAAPSGDAGRAFRAPLSTRRDRGRAHARDRPAPAARAGRARDRLGRRDAATPRWPLREQPIRGSRPATVGRAAASRIGRWSTWAASRRASARCSAPTTTRQTASRITST